MVEAANNQRVTASNADPESFDTKLTARIDAKIATLKESIEELSEKKALAMTVVLTILIVVILYVMLIVYLGVFGYANPDPSNCFYIEGVDTPSITKAAAETLAKDKGIEVKHGYPVDMGHLFRSWFLWGFWCHIIGIII